ncbi:hypothetical protein ACLB2K_063410 [Fragaria x ananassa]
MLELVSDDVVLALFSREAAAKKRTAMHTVLWNWKDSLVSLHVARITLHHLPSIASPRLTLRTNPPRLAPSNSPRVISSVCLASLVLLASAHPESSLPYPASSLPMTHVSSHHASSAPCFVSII